MDFTQNNKDVAPDASGALVIVYRMNGGEAELLMGEETKYITDNQRYVDKYKKITGYNIYDVFRYKGDITHFPDLLAAHGHFTRLAAQVERKLKIGRITYGDVYTSSKPGVISAKPRFVMQRDAGNLGFTKGGVDPRDSSLEQTAAREVFEETDIVIDPDRLINTGLRLHPDPENVSNYVVYLYRLTEQEYRDIVEMQLIENKNKGRYAELHNLQFVTKPDRFANTISKQAYKALVGRLVGGRRTRRRQQRRAGTRRAN
jgi:8-oxo-dGTP pyrophosphatase MutT (NUDIX family)